jgi:hypothetical protein
LTITYNTCSFLTLVVLVHDRDKARWVAQLRDRIEKHEAGTPQFRRNLWRDAFETATYQKHFESPIEKVWSYALPTTAEMALDRACSKSYIAVLPEDEKASVIQDVKAILNRGEDKLWTDESQGMFEYPYQTFVITANQK